MSFCLALPAVQAAHGCVSPFLMNMLSCFAISHVAVSLMWPRQSCTCWKVAAVLLLLSSAATFPISLSLPLVIYIAKTQLSGISILISNWIIQWPLVIHKLSLLPQSTHPYSCEGTTDTLVSTTLSSWFPWWSQQTPGKSPVCVPFATASFPMVIPVPDLSCFMFCIPCMWG